MRLTDAEAQAALGFLISQTSHIEAQVNEVEYPQIQYPDLIPVDTSAPPWSKTVTFFSSDKIGQANWLSGNADDIPLATTERTKHESSVYMAGIGYSYGYEELNHAQALGVPLPADDAMAARFAYEQMIDRIAMDGDTAKGMNGLLAYPGVTVAAATNGNWDTNATSNPDQVLKDFNDGLQLVHDQSNTVAMADTVLLPWNKFNLLASTRLGSNANMTLLGFLQQYNIYTANTGAPLTIRGIRKLDEAGTSVSPPGARMICYRRDPQVLKMHLPMPHRFLPAYQNGPLRFEVPGVFRVGGLDIRRPKEIVYIDGI